MKGDAIKTIMVGDKTYEELLSIKDSKSFTELLSELANSVKHMRKAEILRFAGIINEKEAEELQKIVTKIRENLKARV